MPNSNDYVDKLIFPNSSPKPSVADRSSYLALRTSLPLPDYPAQRVLPAPAPFQPLCLPERPASHSHP